MVRSNVLEGSLCPPGGSGPAGPDLPCATAGADDRLRELGRVAAGAAHDLNHLLTLAAGTIDAVLADAADATGTMEGLGQIGQMLRQAAMLAGSLHGYGRPHAPSAVAIDDAVHAAANLTRRQFGGPATLRLRLAGQGVKTWISRGDLDRVLVNIMINARQAMERGGVLTLRTRQVRIDQDRSWQGRLCPAGDYAVIEAHDTGTGIAPDLLGRIFDADVTTRQAQGGTGQGLATARAIVLDAGGWIDVVSAPEAGTQGSVFSIHLPLYAPPTRSAGRRGTMLFVDDDPALQRVARRALEARGWRVRLAHDCQSAWDVAAECRPDIVVSDLDLPDLDGLSLLRRIHTLHPAAFLVLASGYADANTRDAARHSGILFIEKPYHFDELDDAALGMRA